MGRTEVDKIPLIEPRIDDGDFVFSAVGHHPLAVTSRCDDLLLLGASPGRKQYNSDNYNLFHGKSEI